MRQRFNATYSRTYNDEYVLKMRVNLCNFFLVCRKLHSSSGHVIPWVNEFRHLGVFIARSRLLKCSLDVSKKSFYRAAKAIFEEFGRTASEQAWLRCNWF